MNSLPALAHLGGRLATGLHDVTDDPAALDSSGFWAVVVDFEGGMVFARFSDVREAPLPAAPWRGPAPEAWRTSLDADAYRDGVRRIRAYIEQGEVYQVNLCRMLTAPLPDPEHADIVGLAGHLARGNPAPYGGVIRLPRHGVHVACASPELYLRRRGDRVESGPIKGTGRTEADLLPKDYAENIMIVDLVRNDLSRASAIGTVTVPDLCIVEKHPGLVHLVSLVDGRLAEGAGWPELLAATFPPGSVSGAPKSSAMRIIRELEPVPRGPYCGAVGWVDADRREGELAVGIRSFFLDGEGHLRFGTGAGITYGSDPQGEWDETELKADNLLRVAAGGGLDHDDGTTEGAGR
ncbi:chorismate-binding protein [Yinghuangia seranimata]|uniref:chorismate-binding protein n=1 Tax=Yinghuangia seranimata TaxID=408067 RepID=UPI00248C6699|nr:chorismate-binding protein [Yinghuangia seranimata]MDI2132681.1 chorismate-binding protein [Yinghuangia seranimata]